MMHIDTNKAINQLIKSGVKKETAEIFVEIIEASHKSNFDNLTAKKDLSDVKYELKQDIHELDLKITRIDGELSTKFAKLDGKVDKLQWMVMLSISLSIGILVKLFLH